MAIDAVAVKWMRRMEGYVVDLAGPGRLDAMCGKCKDRHEHHVLCASA
jgi:hypothetical protein